MKIGYNGSTAIKRSNLELDLELCEKYGFDCMEFRLGILDKYFKSGGTVENIRNFFNTSRLKPHGMNSVEFFNMKPPEEFEKIKLEYDRICRLTKELGSDLVITVPTPDVAGTWKEIRENTAECLKQLCDIADRYGIRVGFEMIGFPRFSVNNFADAYEIVQAVGRDNIGCVIDMYHFYINGSSIEDLRKADGSKIFMVHIEDVANKPVGTFDSDADRLMPGDGVFPMREFFRALKETGYNDIVSIELFNPDIWEWDPEKAIRISKEKIEKVLKDFFI